MVSSVATSAVQVEIFPFTSVTVSVMMFEPTTVQSNVLLSIVTVATPQLSNEPLLMSAAVMLACPLLLSCTVMSSQTAVGLMVSNTSTLAVQVLELPLLSITVSVTVLLPTLLQSNTFGLTNTVSTPQLALLPALMSEALLRSFASLDA